VFQACTPSGCRPWVTDGTAPGTRALAEVESSGPFEPAGALLYFAASDRLHGEELWAVPLDAIAPCEDCTPTPTPVSTATRTVAPASATATQSATASSTPTRNPTSTPQPASTPVPRHDGGGGCAIADAGRDADWAVTGVLLALVLLRRARVGARGGRE